MKGVVTAVIIAAVILAGSAVYTRHISSVSERLCEMNDAVACYLEEENFEAAAAETEKIAQYLDKKRTILAATGNHEELDKIEMNMSEMAGYIDGKKQTDAIACSRVLSFLFGHLPKNYELKLENIL